MKELFYTFLSIIIIDNLKLIGIKSFDFVSGLKTLKLIFTKIETLFTAMFIVILVKLKVFNKEQAITTLASLFALAILVIIVNESKKKTTIA
jgi:hypothetical protein